MLWICILVSFSIIYSVVVKIMDQRECPTDVELRSVLFRRTHRNSHKADKVIRHLGVCQECRDKVREINEGE